MLRALALYLLRLLEASLDPDLQARIDAYDLKVKAAEAEEARLLAEIEASRVTLANLTLEALENQRKVIELENTITHIKAEAEEKKAELDRLSEKDKVRVDL